MYFPELLLILFVINSYFCEKPTTEFFIVLLFFIVKVSFQFVIFLWKF